MALSSPSAGVPASTRSQMPGRSCMGAILSSPLSSPAALLCSYAPLPTAPPLPPVVALLAALQLACSDRCRAINRVWSLLQSAPRLANVPFGVFPATACSWQPTKERAVGHDCAARACGDCTVHVLENVGPMLQALKLLTPLVRKLGPNANPGKLKELPVKGALMWAFYAGRSLCCTRCCVKHVCSR